VYDIGPTGTQFLKPATVALRYADADVGTKGPAAFAASTVVGSEWVSLAAQVLDTSAHTLAGQTTHLSIFGNAGTLPDGGAAADGGLGEAGAPSDGGLATVTWTKRGVAPFTGAPQAYMAADSTGTKLVALSGAAAYTSSDSAATWTPRAGAKNGNVIASDAAATNLLAAYRYGGQVYASTDSGATWAQRTVGFEVDAGVMNVHGVAVSADGTHMFVSAFVTQGVTSRTSLWMSTDAGVTWSKLTALGQVAGGDANLEQYDIACDATGTHVALAGYGIFTSSDTGATWTQRLDTTLYKPTRGVQGAANLYAKGISWNAAGTSLFATLVTTPCQAVTSYCSAPWRWTEAGGWTDLSHGKALLNGTQWVPLNLISSDATGTRLLVSSDAATFTSVDSGATWSESVGLPSSASLPFGPTLGLPTTPAGFLVVSRTGDVFVTP
jgi:hypothetical protein